MNNEFYRDPVIVHVMGVSQNRSYVKETMVFVGDVPDPVKKAVVVTHKQWEKKKTVNNKVLKSYYGNTWKEKLGFVIGVRGSQEPDEILDLGDELDQIDLFDVGETFEVDEPEEKPVKEKKQDVPAEKEKDPASKSKPTERKLTIVDDVVLFPEDKVSEFKEKLYLASGGKLAPYKQHIYFLLRNNAIPLHYRITYEGASISVNIMKLFAAKEKIQDIPVDRNFHEMREGVKIEARDQFMTLDGIYSKFGTNTYYLYSIDEFIAGKKGALEGLLSSDKYQLELLYYSFVMKYWPQITMEVFQTYLKSEREMGDIYPDLVPSRGSLAARYNMERQILSHKYELLADACTGYKKNPRFKAYNPEFTIRGTVPPGAAVSVSIKNATLTVERERQYVRTKFGLSITGQIKLDVRNLFDKMRITDDIPLIKVKLLKGRSPFILTKTRDPNSAQGENIRAIFEQVKYQIQLPYYNTILFAVRARDKSGRVIKASQGVSKYVIIVLYDNGKYRIRSVWNEDEKMDFQKIYDVLAATTSPVIKSVNSLGRLVFSSAEHLSKISRGNSEFTELSLSLFWKKTLSAAQFRKVLDMIREEFKSKIIKPKDGDDARGTLEYSMHKGVTGYDITQLEKYISIQNYYMYLSDSVVKQRWLALFDQGRPMIFTHRTTDVKVEVQGIKEQEFRYFYHYVIAFLFKSDAAVKGTRADSTSSKDSAAAIPSIKPGTKVNTLRLLKAKDPEAFIFKKYGSDVVYSRICQKDHQPIPFSPDELKLLPSAEQQRATKFINYTTNSDIYYLCRKGKYPYLSFIVGQHPKDYCLPCCKKTPAYSMSADGKSSGESSKKERVYKTCIDKHVYVEQDEESSTSRYVMNYGKDIYIGRIGKLPDALQQYLLYNLENTDILSEFTIARTFIMDGKKYSVDRLFKITKNIKVHNISVVELLEHLKTKAWEYKREGTADIAPLDVIEHPNKNRKYAKHHNRIMTADMQYPILVYKTDEWTVIVDGLHRLSRAYIEKHKTIKVRYVTDKQLEKVFITEDIDTEKTAEQGTIGVRKTPPVSMQKTIAPADKKKRKRGRHRPKQSNGRNVKKWVKAVKGGGIDEKKPGYFLYGVPQNSRNVQNIGAIYSLAVAFNMDFEEFITFTVKVLRENPNYFQILLNGELIRYFSSIKDLITLMTESFLRNKVIASTQFNRWNELFIDIARICYDKTVIIFDDTSILTTGTSMKVSVVDDVNLVLPNRVRYLEDIIPEDDQPRSYILLLQRRKKSKSAFEKHAKVYYPIFIFVPYIFFKSQMIEKRVYTQHDEIMKLVKGMISSSLSEEQTGMPVQSEIDINTALEFLNDHHGYYIHKLFVNSKDMCYALILSEKGGKSKQQVYLPVSYSYYGGAVRHFEPKKTEDDVVDYNVFERNKYRLSATALKSFIECYNRFVVKKSKAAGMIKTTTEKNTTEEERIIPIYPLIKADHILALSKTPGRLGGNHCIIGVVMKNMHYYLSDVSAGEFQKIFSAGYNIFTFNPKRPTENVIQYLYYDPVSVNKIVVADTKPVHDRRRQLLNRAVYFKHLYKMFVIEFIRYFDRDRNKSLRSKVKSAITSTNFKKADSMQKFREKLAKNLGKFPDDLTRVQEQVNVFYNTHFDKKLLFEEIDSSVYRFDRITLVSILAEADNYWTSVVEEKKKKHAAIRTRLKKIAGNFVKIGEPTFKNTKMQNILASCQDSAVSKHTVYCSGQKLLIPQKKYDDYLDLFADDLINPLKSPYIMALIFMENVLDEFRFERVPGEEIYIKF